MSQFQQEVTRWMHACFGEADATSQRERNHRFTEEALELAQAAGTTREEVLMLVDYVFSRPVGERYQEAGGVMVTLAGLCSAHGLDMEKCGQLELNRVWTKVPEIRAKHALKPRNSPLPGALNTNTN
jgi:hypothetical protein